MSSWTWVAKTLRNLRLATPATTTLPQQSRSPPLMSAAAAQSIIVPPKPKKPLTPYFRFLGQVRDDIKKQNPNDKVPDLMKKAGERWEALDSATKEKYLTEYKNDMESYGSILAKYRHSLTPEQQAMTQQIKLEKQLKKEKREKRRRVKELNKPKKPLTAFLAYLKTQVPAGVGIEVYQKAAKDLGVKWKGMSEAVKAPFHEKWKEEHAKYEKELVKWEEKMLRQGNDDVVRRSQIHKSQTAKPKK